MRRLCQFESVPCGSVSIRRTVCPACIAARANPTASVLLPLPPFWVAKTIVCILNSFGFVFGDLRLRALSCIALRCRAVLAQDVPARSRNSKESRLSESPNPATMTGFGVDDHSGRILGCRQPELDEIADSRSGKF